MRIAIGVAVGVLLAACTGQVANLGPGTEGTDASSSAKSDGNAAGSSGETGDGGSATLFIRDVFSPTIPTNGECTYTATLAQQSETTGVVDVSFSSLVSYTPSVLVESTLTSTTTLQAETSRIIVNGTTTTVTDTAGDTSLEEMFATRCAGGAGDAAACLTGKAIASGTLAAPVNPFSTAISAEIQRATVQAVGLSVISLTLLDTKTIAVLRAYFENALMLGDLTAFTSTIDLITSTQLHAATLGGVTLTSPAFTFPVHVGFGNLVTNVHSVASGGVCVDTTQKVPSSMQTCVPGQDAAVIVSEVPGLDACAM